MAKEVSEGDSEAIDEEAAWFQVASKFMTEKLQPRFPSIQSELCVAINLRTGEGTLLPDVEDRKYPSLGPDVVFGTMDLLCSSGTELMVADWKTGGIGGAEEQLLSLLAATVRAFQVSKVPLPSKLLISPLQVTEERVWTHEREVTLEELDNHIQALQWQWELVGKKGLKPTPGIHCSQLYCEHLAYCPAIKEAVGAAAEMDGIIPEEALLKKKLVDKPVSNEEAADTIELVTAAKRQLTYLTECMKEWVKNNGPIISGVWQWGPGKDGYRWRKRKV